MANYSIKDLEKLSGVKAHTLRIWERRYQLLTPERTQTNIRFYGDGDLRKLLNVNILLQNGWKISKASKLDQEALSKEVVSLRENLPPDTADFLPFINSLLIATLELNQEIFEKLFNTATTRFGLKQTMIHVINPLLRKIGLMWSVWSLHPGQEHFATNLIRQKLCTAIDNIIVFDPKPEKFLLFLPEKEFHEIGLLFSHYWLRSEGYTVTYLGQNTPFNAVAQAAELQNPDCLLTFFIIEPKEAEAQRYVEKLSEIFVDKKVFIAGTPESQKNIRMPSNIQWLSSPEDLMSILEH